MDDLDTILQNLKAESAQFEIKTEHNHVPNGHSHLSNGLSNGHAHHHDHLNIPNMPLTPINEPNQIRENSHEFSETKIEWRDIDTQYNDNGSVDDLCDIKLEPEIGESSSLNDSFEPSSLSLPLSKQASCVSLNNSSQSVSSYQNLQSNNNNNQNNNQTLQTSTSSNNLSNCQNQNQNQNQTNQNFVTSPTFNGVSVTPPNVSHTQNQNNINLNPNVQNNSFGSPSSLTHSSSINNNSALFSPQNSNSNQITSPGCVASPNGEVQSPSNNAQNVNSGQQQQNYVQQHPQQPQYFNFQPPYRSMLPYGSPAISPIGLPFAYPLQNRFFPPGFPYYMPHQGMNGVVRPGCAVLPPGSPSQQKSKKNSNNQKKNLQNSKNLQNPQNTDHNSTPKQNQQSQPHINSSPAVNSNFLQQSGYPNMPHPAFHHHQMMQNHAQYQQHQAQAGGSSYRQQILPNGNCQNNITRNHDPQNQNQPTNNMNNEPNITCAAQNQNPNPSFITSATEPRPTTHTIIETRTEIISTKNGSSTKIPTELTLKNTGLFILECLQPNCQAQFLSSTKRTFQNRLKDLKQVFKSSQKHPIRVHYEEFHKNGNFGQLVDCYKAIFLQEPGEGEDIKLLEGRWADILEPSICFNKSQTQNHSRDSRRETEQRRSPGQNANTNTNTNTFTPSPEINGHSNPPVPQGYQPMPQSVLQNGHAIGPHSVGAHTSPLEPKRPRLNQNHHTCIYCSTTGHHANGMVDHRNTIKSSSTNQIYPIPDPTLICKDTGVMALECSQKSCQAQFLTSSKNTSSFQLKLKNLKQSFKSQTHPLKRHYKNEHPEVLKVLEAKGDLNGALAKCYRAIYLETISSENDAESIENKWNNWIQPSITYGNRSKNLKKNLAAVQKSAVPVGMINSCQNPSQNTNQNQHSNHTNHTNLNLPKSIQSQPELLPAASLLPDQIEPSHLNIPPEQQAATLLNPLNELLPEDELNISNGGPLVPIEFRDDIGTPEPDR